ncbi:MAG: rhomboid family intramembrane serine protease [Janthinobacterium lividum]
MFGENLRFKLHYILWPYLRVLALLLVVMALLGAALATWLPVAELPGGVWGFVGPALLAAVVVLLALWPYLRVVAKKSVGYYFTTRELLTVVAVVTFAFAVGTVPGYVAATLEPLQPLHSLADLPAHPASRYYKVDQLQLDGQNMGVEQQSELAGRHDEYLDFRLFIACPVAGIPASAGQAAVPAWLGFTYRDETSSRNSDAEKEAAYHRFVAATENTLPTDAAKPFYYLERCLDAQQVAAFRTAASHSARYQASAGPPVLLLPVYTPFARRAHHAARVFWWAEALGNGLFVLLLLVLPLDAERQQALLQGRLNRSVAWALAYLQPLWPRQGYVATPLLLDANLLAFGLMAYTTGGSFSGPALLAWGASYGPAIAGGEWWRLLSGTFLHGGISHLANNMVLLAVLGGQLERVLGGLRVAVVYLACGVAASLLSYWWHPEVIGVGASGALFGWMGLGLTLFRRPQVDAGLKAVLVVVVCVSGTLSLIMGFLSPNIDNAAHLGGLAAGVVLGYALWPWLRPAAEATAKQERE